MYLRLLGEKQTNMRKRAESSRGRWVTRRQRHSVRSLQPGKSSSGCRRPSTARVEDLFLTRDQKGHCKIKSLDITIPGPGMRNYFDSHVQNNLEWIEVVC